MILPKHIPLDSSLTMSRRRYDVSMMLVSAWATNFFNGFLYLFPCYSKHLQEIGIDAKHILILGVASHAGLGIIQYPMGLLYKSRYLHSYIASRDLLCSILCIIMQVLSCFGIAIIGHKKNKRFTNTTNFILLLVCFIFYGAGVGGSFGHTIWVTSHNFREDPQRRSWLVASMSMCFGIGACIFTLGYHSFLEDWNLFSLFILQSVLIIVVGFIRMGWMVKLDEISIDVNDKKMQKVTTVIKNENLPGNNSSLSSLVYNPQLDPRPGGMAHLFRSKTFWLTFVATFFGIGIGGSFMSGFNDQVENILKNTEKSTQKENAQFSVQQITLTFLVCQSMGRVVSTLIFYWKAVQVTDLFCIWQIFNVVGLIILDSLFAAAALVGISFGGLWSTFPVLVATKFPGDSKYFPTNFGIMILAPSFGNLVLGVISNATTHQSGSGKYSDSILVLAGIAIFVTILAVGLREVVKRYPKGF